jgi:lipid-binding SYLF domain-containing protein
MRQVLSIGLAVLATTIVASAAISKDQAERIRNAAIVLDEIHKAPDKDVPQELWERASCVGVLPSVKKAAFFVGGEYGKGVMSCRKGTGWSAPSFIELQKGSIGFQIGGESVDLVFLVMNDQGVRHMIADKVSLGAEASVAGGPVGRDARAMTDAQMKAEVLSYSRSQGLFAGVNLSGGVLKPDMDANGDLYGKDVSARDILVEKQIAAPAEAAPFMRALTRTMPRETASNR